jgi:uncharacterized protein (TIGR02145 family)
MKKIICLIVLLQVVCRVSAQDLTISFQPKVSGAPIDSIRATNLRTNQTLKLLGGESLLLVKTPTGIHPLSEIIETGYIYPNPTEEDATFCFSMDKSEEVEIRLYNINGQLLKQNILFLEQETHRFELKFPAAGIYFLSVLKSESTASFKAVYTGSKIQTGSIQYVGSEKINSQNPDANQLKSAKTDKTLAYADGDIIQYSVSSGVNTTIITETPTVSKAFEVEFVNCIDKDGKSYKVVQIGSQWWMAENLAYLPAVYPSSNGSRTDSRYYVFGYQGIDMATARTTSNYKTYGVLYNWPAAVEACPPGWHLPSDAEWTTLTTFLGGEETMAGSKLKESGLTHWTKPNAGATNEIGFSALPAGNRDWYGSFSDVGDYGILWSSTVENTNYAWTRYLSYSFIGVYRYARFKEFGFSVRCIRD